MLLALALAIGVGRSRSAASNLRFGLEISVLILGAITIVTNAVLLYRVHKGTGLTREESDQLGGTLKFGFGYARWRRAIRRNSNG
jgi:hypothetical protein